MKKKTNQKPLLIISLLPEKMKMAVYAVTENSDFQYREDYLQSDFSKLKVMYWSKYINTLQKKVVNLKLPYWLGYWIISSLLLFNSPAELWSQLQHSSSIVSEC